MYYFSKTLKASFEAKLAKPKTCWWTRSKKGGIRVDHLVGLTRTYVRKYRGYVYTIHIGRILFQWTY